MNHEHIQTTTLTIRGEKLAAPELWQQDGAEIHLGCLRCVDRDVCGGLSIKAPVHNCLDLCCGKPESCKKYACPNKPEKYAAHVKDVGGLELRPFTRRVAPVRELPTYVPAMRDAGTLDGPLALPAVAVRLYDVLDRRTGLARYSSREEVLAHFKVHSNARLVIFGTAKDFEVENFWNTYQPRYTAASLRLLRPTLITPPNFSMHLQAPRHDNLLSMARIANVFEDFAAAGLPVAIHPNGRARRDFDRWIRYLNASPHISVIAYELGTVGHSARRRRWHAGQLIRLAQAVDRPLMLALRSGRDELQMLSSVFERIMFTDTTPLMKAKHRQSAAVSHGDLQWNPSPTAKGEPIDELLLHDLRVYRRFVNSLVSKHVVLTKHLAEQNLFNRNESTVLQSSGIQSLESQRLW